MPARAPHGSQQRPAVVQDFCSRAQARFSSFFHGQSILTKERYGGPCTKPEPRSSHSQNGLIAREGLRRDSPLSRSRTSIRSLIDPISSPQSSPATPQAEQLWHYRGAFFRPVSALAPVPRIETQATHQSWAQAPTSVHCERPALSMKPKRQRHCLPSVKDHRIKHKIIWHWQFPAQSQVKLFTLL
ncbi:MAG: hypothetical protein Q9219_000654 [cf. Caloplaca sp. 3 TL-2023]